MRIGVVGLGTMGAPMARHLIAAGHQVVVHNRTREREQALAALGAGRAGSPAEAAADADAVLTCVSDTPDLEQVLFGASGAAAGLGSGALVVDCSTVSPAATSVFAARLAGQGVGMVDAPVSGGSEGAERGTLTVFVGGAQADVARALPLLQTFGSRITHLGPSGAGQAAKAVNQVIISGTYATVAEGIALAEAAGLPLDALVEALSAGAAASWVLANRAANMVTGTYPLGFRVALHRKDLGIALDEAARAGLTLPVSSLVAAEEDRLIELGHGDEDVSALARVARERVAGERPA
ncbi:MAG TPA: NAD(P)-dependent oxidoreductase [Gaiellales bacterium]|nr:NAD(P)-dependent oxidoreductase [Gaiellales bacterium]